MTAFNQERAIARYTELMRLISVGAYQERDIDGSSGEDGIEKAVAELELKAVQHGLVFRWHEHEQHWTLKPLTPEERAPFLIASLPSGIEREVRTHYQAHGDFLPSV